MVGNREAFGYTGGFFSLEGVYVGKVLSAGSCFNGCLESLNSLR